MPLYAVERELSHVSPEQLQRGLKEVRRLCRESGLGGKNVRYISSVFLPAEHRGLCLFGAEDAEWIREVQEAAGMPYSRIVALLDLTPNDTNRDVSRKRRPILHMGSRFDADAGGGAMSPNPAHVVARWFEEGRRVFGAWAARAERLEQRHLSLEQDREQLRRTITQLEHDNQALHAQREELLAAFDALAGSVIQAVDEVVQSFRREDHSGRPEGEDPDRGK